MAETIQERLRKIQYPGRCLVVARVLSGELSVVYVITGRSESSRHRQLRLNDDGSIDVVDHRGAGEDALRHYRALTCDPNHVIVGNGGHVEDLRKVIMAGRDPASALLELEYEPDPPIFTPRITAIIGQDELLLISSAYRPVDNSPGAERLVIRCTELPTGSAMVLTTYAGGSRHVSVSREVSRLACSEDTGQELINSVWRALDPHLRVAAVLVRPNGGKEVTVAISRARTGRP